jgi:signal transduction histidine kinase
MNWLFTKQIRSRLTLWYIAVLASILALYVLLVFLFQYQFVSRQIFHDEVQDVVTVEGLLHFDHEGQLHLQQDYFSRPLSHLLIDRLMEVRDLSGNVLYRSANLKDMPLGGSLWPHEGDESFDPRIWKLPNGTHVSVISHLHTMQGRTVLIRLGFSLAPFRERMTEFLELLFVALPIALLVAGFAGYQIAKRALDPLEEMARKARQITARNLHDRLDIENPDDELGRMATVFNDLLNRLEEAFQQLNSFTADAAHELRAPMSAIRAIGEIALRHEVAHDSESIANILEETSRLEETIGGLLLLAKAESTQELGPNTFAPEELLREVLAILEVLAEERRINLVTEIESTNSFAVSGDRNLIRSAMMNVVHNAIKFSPSDSTITIRHALKTMDRTIFELSVEDQGPGVEPSEREALFERFYTSTKRQTISQNGTGLGLSIAKLVVERAGGQIYFDPEHVLGARCVLNLPAKPIVPKGEEKL